MSQQTLGLDKFLFTICRKNYSLSHRSGYEPVSDIPRKRHVDVTKCINLCNMIFPEKDTNQSQYDHASEHAIHEPHFD